MQAIRTKREMPLCFTNSTWGKQYVADLYWEMRREPSILPFPVPMPEIPENTTIRRVPSSTHACQLETSEHLPTSGSFSSLPKARGKDYEELANGVYQQGYDPPIKSEVLRQLDRALPPTPASTMFSVQEARGISWPPCTPPSRSLPPTPGSAPLSVQEMIHSLPSPPVHRCRHAVYAIRVASDLSWTTASDSLLSTPSTPHHDIAEPTLLSKRIDPRLRTAVQHDRLDANDQATSLSNLTVPFPSYHEPSWDGHSLSEDSNWITEAFLGSEDGSSVLARSRFGGGASGRRIANRAFWAQRWLDNYRHRRWQGRS